jgi:hypothetical protein
MTITINATFSKVPTATEDGILGMRVLGDSPITRPIHIGLVLDTSGSMEGERIKAVKKTLTVLIDKLVMGDKISVVGFANEARVLLRSHVITADNKAATIDTVNLLDAEGGTNMECGIVGIGSSLGEEMPDAVVLLTDGQVNQGITSAAGLGSLIRSYLQAVPVYTLGYGEDHNAGLLKALASRTQGTYTYVNNELVLPESVGDLLGGLQSEVAKAATILFPQTWACLELTTVEKPGEYQIGSIIADKPTWIMFKIPAGSTVESNATIQYKDCVSSELYTKSCVFDTSLDVLDITEQELRCQTARTLEEIGAMLQQGTFRGAKIKLNVMLDLLNASVSSRRPLVIHMKAQIEEMIEDVKRMEMGTPDRRQITAMAMRTTSLGANYSAQRGVTGGGAVFSSPRQREARTQMVTLYSQEDPAL